MHLKIELELTHAFWKKSYNHYREHFIRNTLNTMSNPAKKKT